MVAGKAANQVSGSLSKNIDKNDSLLITKVQDNISDRLPKRAWERIHKNVPNKIS